MLKVAASSALVESLFGLTEHEWAMSSCAIVPHTSPLSAAIDRWSNMPYVGDYEKAKDYFSRFLTDTPLVTMPWAGLAEVTGKTPRWLQRAERNIATAGSALEIRRTLDVQVFVSCASEVAKTRRAAHLGCDDCSRAIADRA